MGAAEECTYHTCAAAEALGFLELRKWRHLALEESPGCEQGLPAQTKTLGPNHTCGLSILARTPGGRVLGL